MKPIRLRNTYELLLSYQAFEPENVQLVEPRPATEQEILSFHTIEYVRAVQNSTKGRGLTSQSAFNLGTTDNPSYKGIYEASCWSTGASLKAVQLLIARGANATFNISGGLHHAMPGYAHGFCVFNDPVIAIKALVSEGMRVAYVDIDCHHGDGVQHAFYDTDKVITISLHEDGAYLFPGTGYPQEIGTGEGRGYSVNVPLYPYTSDEVYLWAFQEVVPPLLASFKPDALVTQLGIDSHYLDPITHLALTVQGYGKVVAELRKLAPSKWLALGGGGYSIQAVARAWTLAFGIISGQDFPDKIPSSYSEQHNVTELTDHQGPKFENLIVHETRNFATKSVQAVQRLVFPHHGIKVT